MKRPLLIVLISGLVVVAIAAGALVSDAVGGSGSSSSLAPVAAPVAVVGPSDGHFGDLPAGTPGGGSTAGGTSPAATPIFNPEGLVSPPVPGSGSGAARFIDPCADHGSSCGGVGSTILGDTFAPPFAISLVLPQNCLGVSRTDPVPFGVPVTIQSNLAGDFVVTLTDRSGTHEVHRGRGSTTSSEILYEGGTGLHDSSGAPVNFNTCVSGFILPNRTTIWDVSVDGTSADGQTTTHTSSFQYDGTGGRPPVQIDTPAAPFENQLRVVVPSKSGSRGGVIVRLLTATVGAPGSTCRRDESDFGLFALAPRDTTLPIPAAELSARGYPYDLAYDSRETHIFGTTATDGLSEGGTYDLCIWWLDNSRPNHVTERASYRVRAPNRYTVFVRVARIDFTHARAPSGYTVTTDLNAAGPCRIVPSGTDLVTTKDYTDPRLGFDPAMYPGPSGGCNHELGLEEIPGTMIEGATWDRLLRVEVTGGGRDVVDYLHMPLSGCPDGGGACDTNRDFSEDYVISLGSRTTGLCGSSFGDCDPPREEIGTITIRLRFLGNQPADGVRFWQVDATPHTF